MNYKEDISATPIRSYIEIAADNPSIRTNREFGDALADAWSIIGVNELFDVLPLESETERQVFMLGLADRFLREKDYFIRNRKKPSTPAEFFRKQGEEIFYGPDDVQIRRIYEAFDVLHTERDLLTKDADQRSLDRAHAIWLAASHLFPAFQQSNPFGKRLQREFPIPGDTLVKWSIGWQNKLAGIDQNYAVTG